MTTNLNVKVRFAILARDGFRCFYCGRMPNESELEVDHIVPRSRGGTNRPDNLVACCARCNVGKADELFVTELRELLSARVFEASRKRRERAVALRHKSKGVSAASNV